MLWIGMIMLIAIMIFLHDRRSIKNK
jgi:hypothetical protein